MYVIDKNTSNWLDETLDKVNKKLLETAIRTMGKLPYGDT